MNSLILKTVTPFMVPLIALFSVYVLLRGHNEPGGGFIGGLICASAFALYAISDGPAAVRKAMPVQPIVLAGMGLVMAIVSGLGALFSGDPFLTGLWFIPESAPDFKFISTVVLFDIGVYCVVVGTVTAFVLALEEDI